MTPLDVVEDIGSGPVVHPIHPLTFEYDEEALGGRIVGATAHRAHAVDDRMAFQKPWVFLRGEVTAPIQVQNNRGVTRSLLQGHQHRVDNQLTVLTRTH